MIYESGENYLETILRLKVKNPIVRSVDIIQELNYSKSSVSRAVNLLKNDGFIVINNDGSIDFTEKGKKKATSIYSRHKFLSEFLVNIGVERDIAEEDACKLEHGLSEESFLALQNLVKNLVIKS